MSRTQHITIDLARSKRPIQLLKLRNTQLPWNRILVLGPLVLGWKKRTPAKPAPTAGQLMTRTQGLSYREWLTLLIFQVRNKPRHALGTRLAYTHGVSVENAAHYIEHGYL